MRDKFPIATFDYDRMDHPWALAMHADGSKFLTGSFQGSYPSNMHENLLNYHRSYRCPLFRIFASFFFFIVDVDFDCTSYAYFCNSSRIGMYHLCIFLNLGQIRMYELKSKSWLLTRDWKAHDGVIRDLKWHSNGAIIVSSCSKDNTVKVWDTTGTLLLDFFA